MRRNHREEKEKQERKNILTRKEEENDLDTHRPFSWKDLAVQAPSNSRTVN